MKVSHYNKGKIEVIDFIQDKELNFNLGNVIKYISRAKHKGTELQDLKKALDYLTYEVHKKEDLATYDSRVVSAIVDEK